MTDTKEITVTLGDTDFTFDVGNTDYNKMLNNMSGSRAVQAGFNLLSSTVKQEQRATLISIITDKEKKPHGTVVLEVVGIISEEFTDSLPTAVKKRSSTPTPADEMDMTD